MSAPVDVLAVLESAIAHAGKMAECLRQEGRTGDARRWDSEAKRQRETREAVCHLMAAAGTVVRLGTPCTFAERREMSSRLRHLQSQLARCGGAE